jgi:transketolase
VTGTDTEAIAAHARQMRRDIVQMVADAGSGHPGGSLSAAEIVSTLYFGVMRHRPDDSRWEGRDRFVLSKGHAAPVLYSALAEAGYFDRSHLSTLRKLGSILQGHPDMHKVPGVEVSTGSLGQGLALANGIALSLRLKKNADSRVYCLMGDGELQEGEVWEAAMLAAHYDLGNVIAIVDHNGLQIDGPTDEVMGLREIGDKFSAFGWLVIGCDGHSVDALLDAFDKASRHTDGPVVIVAQTTKGKGVSFMENNCDWHGKAPSAEQCAAALEELA